MRPPSRLGFNKMTRSLIDKDPVGWLSCPAFYLRREQIVFTVCESIVAQSQGFRHSRLYKLRRLQSCDGLHLASAIEQSLAVTDDPTGPVRPMMILDINNTLDRVAASCAFSSPARRGAIPPGSIDSHTSLLWTFRRFFSVEAKWLVRLLIKGLRPAVMPVPLTLR